MNSLLCPKCGGAIEMPSGEPPSKCVCPECGTELARASDETVSLVRGGDDDTITYVVQRHQSDAGTRDAATFSNFGDYELLEEIARGGMGVVYRARHRPLNRIVAVKMILAGRLASESEVKRFHHEAEAAAGLDHPNIVPVYEVGEQDGRQFFAMGFVEGQSLQDAVQENPLSPRESAGVTATIATAVQYAHSKGIVHRDLKPGNVLIDQDGQPRITDFGLAKRTEADAGMTATGQIVGTPAYMPPEQASGDIEKIGPTADVYSLGAILYYLLTGRPPFQSDSVMETLKQVLERDPVSPRMLNPAVDRDLETICLKCLEKDAAKRYASAADLANDLIRYQEGKPIVARPIGRIGRITRWCRRRPLPAALILTVAVVAIAGVVGIAAQWQRAEANYQQSQENLKAANEATQRANDNLTTANAAQAKAVRSDKRTQGALKNVLTRLTNDSTYMQNPGTAQLRYDVQTQTLNYFTELLRERPDDIDLQWETGQATFWLALTAEDLGKRKEAMAGYHAALRLFEKIEVKRREKQVALKLADCYGNIAGLYFDARNFDQARSYYSKAHAYQRRMLKASPNDARARVSLAKTCFNLGEIIRPKGPLKEAFRLYNEAHDLLKPVLQSGKAGVDVHITQMKCTYSRGMGYLAVNRLDRSYQLARQSAQEGDQAVKAVGFHLRLLDLTALTWRNAGAMAFKLRRYQAAADHIGRANVHYRTVLKKQPGNSVAKNVLFKSLGMESLCWFRLKRPKELERLALEIRKLWVNDPRLYEAASNIAITTTLIGDNGRPRSAAEQKEWTRLADLAVRILREAVNAGFKDVAKVRKDTGFRAIQNHPPLKELLQRLSRPSHRKPPVVARKPLIM